jgi:hypothetical protein
VSARGNLAVDWFGSGDRGDQPVVVAPASVPSLDQNASPDARLQKLKGLKKARLITESEFQQHRARILGEV